MTQKSLEERLGIIEQVVVSVKQHRRTYAFLIALTAPIYSSTGCGDGEESECCKELDCGKNYHCVDEGYDPDDYTRVNGNNSLSSCYCEENHEPTR